LLSRDLWLVACQLERCLGETTAPGMCTCASLGEGCMPHPFFFSFL
jgi:hypothetical protein